jgi:hypothetical protein
MLRKEVLVNPDRRQSTLALAQRGLKDQLGGTVSRGGQFLLNARHGSRHWRVHGGFHKDELKFSVRSSRCGEERGRSLDGGGHGRHSTVERRGGLSRQTTCERGRGNIGLRVRGAHLVVKLGGEAARDEGMRMVLRRDQVMSRVATSVRRAASTVRRGLSSEERISTKSVGNSEDVARRDNCRDTVRREAEAGRISRGHRDRGTAGPEGRCPHWFSTTRKGMSNDSAGVECISRAQWWRALNCPAKESEGLHLVARIKGRHQGEVLLKFRGPDRDEGRSVGADTSAAVALAIP